MNYKSPIQKVMVPAMEQAGFSFLAIGYNHFCFANGSETQEIVIDTARYGVRNLRFAYHGTGERRFWFGLEDLDPQFCPAAGMEYRTREELIPYLRQVTEDTVRILLPYLDAMVENYVAYTDVLSREMARDIQERIKRAQAQWGLALEYGPDQLRRLDAAMDALRTAAVRRREKEQSRWNPMGAANSTDNIITNSPPRDKRRLAAGGRKRAGANAPALQAAERPPVKGCLAEFRHPSRPKSRRKRRLASKRACGRRQMTE